ncbi:MAG: hypothetical protein KDD66_15590 [Bdellovibrionales bacterium]|nr:hypothetical protein [Bdellovibrionales bacterium]
MFTQQMSSNEIAVLKSLFYRKKLEQEPLSEISDIANVTGIRSNEEVQRALYILEGKSLVTPEPAGDLTSSQWQITDVGQRAVDVIDGAA